VITLRKDEILLPEGKVCLQEYEALHVEIRPYPAISDVPRLTLDGADLNPGPSVKHDGSGLVFTWVFRPECWCGRMQLHASHGSHRAVVNVTVSAAANKLDAGEYDAMLSRVLARASALPWGLAPGQVDASLADGPQLGALHPVVVANLLPGLLKQLRSIVAEPVLALRPSEAVVALRPGMKLDVAERRALMSRPDRRQRLQRGDPTLTMVRLRRSSSLDHPANRWVVGTVTRLRRALLRTGALLDEVPTGWGDLERARAALLARQARAGEAEIGAALDGSDFAELPPGLLSESASLVLADHPAYAGFNRVARRMLAASAQMDSSGAIEASLRRTWDLFEFDCLFRVIDHLEDALGPTWRSQCLPLRHTILAEIPKGEFWRAENGQGGRWSLYSQQTFSGMSDMTRTISTERRPDFVLTYRQGEQLVRWILLDAKYRVGSAGITDALADMHVYRDSLRWLAGAELMAPEAGYLLVPAVSEGTQRFAKPAYRQTHSFGLVTLNDRDFFKDLVRPRSYPPESCVSH